MVKRILLDYKKQDCLVHLPNQEFSSSASLRLYPQQTIVQINTIPIPSYTDLKLHHVLGVVKVKERYSLLMSHLLILVLNLHFCAKVPNRLLI